MNRLFAVVALLLVGCAGSAPRTETAAPLPPAPPAPPTHAAPIDDPLPAPASDQILVELRVIHSGEDSGDALALPTTLPSDSMLRLRLRTLATLEKPFACDAGVQETNARLTGTISALDRERLRASVSFIERFGIGIRQITTRVELRTGESLIIGRMLAPQGQDLLVLTLQRGEK
jgi:hypothetical protein